MTGCLEDVLKQRNIPFRTLVCAKSLCTFRIGGIVSLVIEPSCICEFVQAIQLCRKFGRPFAVIGKGSNLLFADAFMDIVLIRTVALDAVRIHSDGRVVALCGVSLTALARRVAQEGLTGLEFACGIPGTVGGGVFMNAGAHGKEMSDVVESVDALSENENEIKTYFHRQLNFSYRNSFFQTETHPILRVTLRLQYTANIDGILRRMRENQAARQAKQPIALPSAGSIFIRPGSGVAMGRVIEELGLKGLRVGGAEISHQHAGFIVNRGNATAADVKTLMTIVQNTVERERGFRPIPEIRFIPECL